MLSSTLLFSQSGLDAVPCVHHVRVVAVESPVGPSHSSQAEAPGIEQETAMSTIVAMVVHDSGPK